MLALEDITTDPEIASALRPLTDDERRHLTDDIRQNGFDDSLIVWRGRNILIDGHNRFDIWHLEFNADPDFTPTIVEREFPDKASVIQYVRRRQWARRNLTAEELSYNRGREFHEQKSTRGGDRKSNRNDCGLTDTADELAKKHNVSPRTIENDARFATAVDTIAQRDGDDVKQDILAGTSGLSRKGVIARAGKKTAPKKEPAIPHAKNHRPVRRTALVAVVEAADALVELSQHETISVQFQRTVEALREAVQTLLTV